IIDQVLEALSYLHQRGVLHMDLKPDNILVEEGIKNAVLIDLGFSLVASAELFTNHFTEMKNRLSDKDPVHVSSTENYTREAYRPYLGQNVARVIIRDKMFPDHDLFAL